MKTFLQNISKTILLFTLICNLQFALAQAPAIEWQKALGGGSTELGGTIDQTADGGYIVVGQTLSTDGDVLGNVGGYSYWVVKINNLGVLQWQKTFGGSGEDFAQSVQQTNDGGYIIAGYTYSNDGDITGSRGGLDCWIIKLNSIGTLQWQKTLGGSLDDNAQNIQQTQDGGYIVTGWTASNNGDVTGNHGSYDYWVVKLNSTGIIQWQKALGGSSTDDARSIHQTIDGGYIVAGYAVSNNGDVTGNHGSADYWVVKLTSLGVMQWQRTLGGSATDIASSIKQTSDGGYIVAGTTDSTDGDVTGNHGGEDAWVVKLNASGTILWQKTFGGTRGDYALDIQQTNEGGYIVAMYSSSNNGDVFVALGNYDYWIVKLSESGIIQWQKTMGGTDSEYANSIQITNDNGYVVAGTTFSNNVDVTGNHGRYDFWVVKLASDPLSTPTFNNKELILSPNPTNSIINFQIENTTIDKITITDLAGKKIMEQNGKSNQINVAQLQDGLYLLQIKSGEKNYIAKFIKQ